MLAIVQSLVLNGLDAVPVQVEVDILGGLPNFEVVGLPSAAVKEARERVRSAIKNSGFEFPNRRLTVNLAPADIKKEGSHFDLPIALGILLASGQIIPTLDTQHFYYTGELSLNGEVRPIPGILPMVLELVKHPGCRLILPFENADEAALVPEVEAGPVVSLQQLAEVLQGTTELPPLKSSVVKLSDDPFRFPDFAEVKGQETAKRALQVAAAGRHNILLIGAPGGGKTMLARRMSGIMPPMTREETLETTKIYSVAGLLDSKHPLIETCPFRSPHKNASAASIIGGGRTPHPGEISLSHHGILFLDEMPEFTRDVLEALRQPLEDRVITVARAAATYTYPADFMLIGAMNPCPCGNYGSDKPCNCSPLQIQKYLKRISGPLLDRMDLHVEVPRVQYDQLSSPVSQLDSATMRQSIIEARKIQQERFKKSGISRNSQMQTNQIRKHCKLDSASEEMLRTAFERLQMSARAYTRVLKVSRTIADLNGEAQISMQHLSEALQYRSLDKKYWPQ